MDKKEKKKIGIALLIAVIVSSLFIGLSNLDFFHSLEMKTFDKRLEKSKTNTDANKDVVVILIDEASLQLMGPLVGRWPWPRSLYGDLLEFLASAGARAVLFDILFPEPQVPRDATGNLGESDSHLVMGTASSGIAHHAFQIIHDIEDEVNNSMLNNPIPKEFVEKFSLKNVDNVSSLKQDPNNFYIPITEVYQNARDMGVVEFSSDADGVYRSTNLIRQYQGNFYPTLSMSYLNWANKYKKIKMEDDKILLDSLQIPLLEGGRYIINMKKNIVNYSMGGVLATIQKINKGEMDKLMVNPEEFKDKIIILGASAVGVEDLKLTSLGKSVPGVYLHASAISNVLDQDFIKLVSKNWIYIITSILAFIIAMMVLRMQSVLPSVIGFFGATSTYIYICFFLFDKYRLWLLLVIPVLILFFSFLSAFIFKSITEGKEKKFLKAAFGNYISPELIDIMYSSGEAPKLGGDVGLRTAFFTDIQGFSSFSEKLSAPKLVELLNEYLTVMTDILIAEQGTLDKYEGDAIIAFFGAPMPLPDHASRALKVSLKMQAALGDLRKKWTSEGDKWPEIVHNMRMRIGINSGEIVTGNMGSKMRMNYTMMGDSVNLAARLEASAKQYGIFTQISHFTYNLIKDEFECRELDTIRVVGKSEPVTTYEPLGIKGQTDNLLIDLKNKFHEALTFYKNKNWDKATELFNLTLQLENVRFPELEKKPNPSKIYLERCLEFKQNPPPENWDGVYTLTEK